MFEPEAVEFIARKVSAASGDARRALDIARRAAELAEIIKAKKSPSKKGTASSSKSTVAMQHVQSAIEEMFSSPKLLAIQACSVHEQMFLNNWNLRRPLLPRCTPMYCSNSFNHTTNSSEYLVSTWISQISSDFGTRCRWAADQYLDDVRWCCRWKEMAFRSSPAPTNRSACRYYGLAE